jgi:uncharacterized membrane-anchored protein
MHARLPLAVVGLALATRVFGAEPAEIHWTSGPATVPLGSQAEMKLGEGYAFAGAADTQKLMQSMGNSVSNREVGLINPKAHDQDWILVFEYESAGYVKDDDKDKIDKQALLDSIREGTEESNKRRKELGVPGLHVTGWFEEPHYDTSTHNLVWALAAKDDNGVEVVNYNMRVLGRDGYMSITLVDSPAKLAASKVEVAALMSGFSYKAGKTYAEFRPGDKIAEYGLAALVTGGAGVAAAKLGLFAWLFKFLAKGGKAAIAAGVAAVAGLRAFFARLFGRKREAT